jgi:hypothetical protein
MAASRRRTVSRKNQPAARAGARLRPRALTAILVVLVVAAALAAACSAQATVGAAGSDSPGATDASAGTAASPGATEAPGVPSAKGASGADWTRVVSALAYMQATTPTQPVVVLLGGSAARESTISDKSWRAQIESAGGPATLAWNLGSRNRTMAQNVAIVRALPKVPTIVYIGINLGSFTSAQKRATITLPSPAPTSVSLQQPHSYSKNRILSTAKKRQLVSAWLADRYPVFKRNFSTSAGVLETLIKVCQTRGFYPVLFELPRNTAVIGSRLNAPRIKYRTKCLALSKKYHVPWVSLVKAAKLPNRSFYDLWHLVEPGRTVWQRLLSAKTAKILTSSAFDGGGS